MVCVVRCVVTRLITLVTILVMVLAEYRYLMTRLLVSMLCVVQEDYVRKLVSDGNGQGTSSDDLPDYQEQSEQATLDFDIRPSTSHANSGTPFSDEQQDDNGDQLAGDEYNSGYDVGDAEQGVDDDDIILVDDDDVSSSSFYYFNCFY